MSLRQATRDAEQRLQPKTTVQVALEIDPQGDETARLTFACECRLTSDRRYSDDGGSFGPVDVEIEVVAVRLVSCTVEIGDMPATFVERTPSGRWLGYVREWMESHDVQRGFFEEDAVSQADANDEAAKELRAENRAERIGGRV